jgi:hypothetical protein
MAVRDFQLGMDNVAAEPFVDVVLLLTACSFTLLVGIIIGYYVEVFFKNQKILGGLAGAPSAAPSISRSEGRSEGQSGGYDEFDGRYVEGGRSGIARNSGLGSAIGHLPAGPETLLLNTKPCKIPKHIAVIMDGNRRFGKQKHGNALQVLFIAFLGLKSLLMRQCNCCTVGSLGWRANPGGLYSVVQGGRCAGTDRLRILYGELEQRPS